FLQCHKRLFFHNVSSPRLQLFYMLMCKQMVLTVFIIAVAFGTETELQIRIVLLCTPADGTFMLGNAAGFRVYPASVHSLLKIPPPLHFLRPETAHTSSGKEEKYKIQERSHNGNCHHPDSKTDISHHIINDHNAIYPRHPFHTDRDHEKQKDLHIRITCRIGKKYRHTDIVSGKHIAHKINPSRDKICQKRRDHHKQKTGKNIQVIPECAPGAFQRRPNGVIKKQYGNCKPHDISCTWRINHPCDQPPYLPLEYHCRLQAHHIQKCRVELHQDISQHI